MKFMQSVRNMLGRKDTQSRVLISLQSTGPYVETPRNYEAFSDEGFRKNVVVFRSVHWVASSCASVPWVLYQKPRGKGGKRVEIDDHPFLDLIRKPNPMQSQAAFFESVVAFKQIAGNSYIQAVGPGKNPFSKVTELWPLRPDRMRIKPGPRGYPAAYIYKLNHAETVFPVDQVRLQSPVLHMKYFNPTDDWYGMSPLEAAVYATDQHNSANKWNLSLLQNSARPSGALVATVGPNSSGTLSEEQYQRLKHQIDEQHTGARNAARPMILEGGLDWKPLSMTPQQMDWIEGKNMSARDIALAFGVPPMMLGIPGDNTYSNYQEARAAMYEDTAIPIYDSVRDDFNAWLVPSFGDGLEADYDKDAIHALAPRRQSVWDKVQKADWLTVNEKREATGYDAIDSGDVILVNSTEIPLEDAIENPDAATGAQDDPNESQSVEEDDGFDDETGATDSAQNGTGKGLRLTVESKIFNLPNRKAKEREARGQLRMRAGFKRRMHRQVQAVFDIEGHRVAEAVKGLDPQHAQAAAIRAIDANHAQWKTVLTSNLTATTRAFGERVFNSLKHAGFAVEKKASESQFDSFVTEWIRDHVGERITQLDSTTKDRIIKAIRDAQEEAYTAGEGVQDLSDRIEEIYSGFSEGRAETIARTETGIAANMGLMEAAKSTGVPNLQKEWVSVNDGRTRDDHQAVDGTLIDMDESFNVGGFDMKQPMDPSGPPEEVINCRCAMVFSRNKGDASDEGDSQ